MGNKKNKKNRPKRPMSPQTKARLREYNICSWFGQNLGRHTTQDAEPEASDSSSAASVVQQVAVPGEVERKIKQVESLLAPMVGQWKAGMLWVLIVVLHVINQYHLPGFGPGYATIFLSILAFSANVAVLSSILSYIDWCYLAFTILNLGKTVYICTRNCRYSVVVFWNGKFAPKCKRQFIGWQLRPYMGCLS